MRDVDTVWTADRARECLVREMRDGRAVYSPRAGPVITAIHDNHLECSVFNAIQRVGLRDEDGGRRRQTMMLVWAAKEHQRREYAARGARPDASLNDVIREKGWSPQTFQRQVNEGFDIVTIILQTATDAARATIAALRKG